MLQFIKDIYHYLFPNPSSPLAMMGLARSTRWPTIRKQHLEIQPNCQVCGGTNSLNVHHIVPVHVDPSKELDLNNLITLCEGSHHLNCHLLFGHLQDWHCTNSNVLEDVKIWSEKIANRS